MTSRVRSTTNCDAVVLDYALYRILYQYVASNGTDLGVSHAKLANGMPCFAKNAKIRSLTSEIYAHIPKEELNMSQVSAPALYDRWKAVTFLYMCLGGYDVFPVTDEQRRRIQWLSEMFKQCHCDSLPANVMCGMSSPGSDSGTSIFQVHAVQMLIPLFFDICAHIHVGEEPANLTIKVWEALHMRLILTVYYQILPAMGYTDALEAVTCHGPFGEGYETPPEYAWTARSSSVQDAIHRNFAAVRESVESVNVPSIGELLQEFVKAVLGTHPQPKLVTLLREHRGQACLDMVPHNILSASHLR